MANTAKNTWLAFTRSPVENDQGMVLVMALMVMVILSLLAAFATTMSNTERMIAANDEIYTHNFYAAEAVCVEAGANLEAIPNNNLKTTVTWGVGNTYPWLESAMPTDPDPDGDGTPGTNLELQANWPMAGAPQVIPATTAQANITPPGSAPPDRIQYASQKIGVTGSLIMGQPQTHVFALYGMYDVNRGAGKSYTGKVLIAMGFKKLVYP